MELKLNDNFYKKEFQKLWKKINVKTAYAVDFNTEELLERCIRALDTRLRITDVFYQITDGVLEDVYKRQTLP